MKKINEFVAQHPLLVIIVISIITLIMGIACTTLRLETDIKKMLPQGSPAMNTFNEIDAKFGGADQLYMIIADQDIIDAATLTKMREMAGQIKKISGVSHVISITNIDEIKPAPDGIEVAPLIGTIPTKAADLARLKQKLLSDDKYAGVLLSRDGSAALVLVKLFVERDDNVVSEIKALVSKYEGPEKIYLTGSPYVAKVIQAGIAKDMFRLIPLGIFLVALILYLSFRNWYGVVLPLVTVVISSVWSMGFLALLGQPMTVVTSAVPVLLISVGSAYGIHLITRFEEEDGTLTPQQRLDKALSRTGIAIFIAAATTVAGFLSNAISGIVAIRTFGCVAAFGVAIAFLIAEIFIPAVLRFAHNIRPSSIGQNHDHHDWLYRLLNWFGERITAARSWFFIVTLILILLAVVAYPRLSTESDPVKYFSEKSEIARTAELVKQKFGGGVTFDVVINGDLKDPVLLKKIARLQAEMARIDLLGHTYSIVDAIKETNCYFNGGRKEFKAVPNSRQGVAQYLLLLSMTGSELIDSMVTPDHEEALIQARLRTTKKHLIDGVLKQINPKIKEIFGDDRSVRVRLSGMGIILKDMSDMLISNQVQSLALALIIVFLMVLVFYRDLVGSIFCMIPIVVTLLLNFGVMSWFNISLDMATVMVASIAVGMGIDYQVHFYNRLREEMGLGRSLKEAIIISLKMVGKPIIYNAIAVAVGFFILIFSEFEILKSFGILVALTMGFAAFGALAILPDLFMIRSRLGRK